MSRSKRVQNFSQLVYLADRSVAVIFTYCTIFCFEFLIYAAVRDVVFTCRRINCQIWREAMCAHSNADAVYCVQVQRRSDAATLKEPSARVVTCS